MKGTDLTSAQIHAAEQFIFDRAKGAPKPANGMVYLTWDSFVRILAWYGAMRYQAGRDGINSLENPGHTYIVSQEQEKSGD
jgi:hypothetical protein